MIHNDESGFTLIELIAAAVVFGILVIGIVNLYIATEVAQRKSYDLAIATRAGEREIESLRNAQYGALTPGVQIDFSADLPDELPNPKTGIVDVSEPEVGLRRVDITITYKDGGGTNTVKQTSYIGIIGIGQ